MSVLIRWIINYVESFFCGRNRKNTQDGKLFSPKKISNSCQTHSITKNSPHFSHLISPFSFQIFPHFFKEKNQTFIPLISTRAMMWNKKNLTHKKSSEKNKLLHLQKKIQNWERLALNVFFRMKPTKKKIISSIFFS